MCSGGNKILSLSYSGRLLTQFSHCCAQQPDVPAYTICDIQLQNVAPDDGLKSPKHVEHLMINKDTL